MMELKFGIWRQVRLKKINKNISKVKLCFPQTDRDSPPILKLFKFGISKPAKSRNAFN
jgi:hypothetical protein